MLIFIIMPVFIVSAYCGTQRPSGTAEVGKLRYLGPVREESPGCVLQEGSGLSGNSGSLADGDGEYTKENEGARREDRAAS